MRGGGLAGLLSALLLVAGPARAQELLVGEHGRRGEGGFAQAFGAAGDVDGDGRADWIVSAPFNDYSLPRAGSVTVTSGKSGEVLLALEGSSSRELDFGFAACGLGDLDGDGRGEVAVASFPRTGVANRSGKISVFSGADGKVLRQLASRGRDDWFGQSLGRAGDVDGDGTPDLWVGAPRRRSADGTAREGAVFLFSGADGALLREIPGPGGRFGVAAAAIGDLDGDGCDELVIGAPDLGGGAGARAGGAFVHSGKTGEQLFAWTGECAGRRLGSAVSGGLRIDGDAHPDVLVAGAGGGEVAGILRTFSGADGAALWRLELEPHQGLSGPGVAAIGDADGDGADELLLSRCTRDARGYPFWIVDLRGAATGDLEWSLERFDCGQPFRSPVAVAACGDIDGDGRPDLMLGSTFHRHTHPLNVSGAVQILAARAPAAATGAPRLEADWLQQRGIVRLLQPPVRLSNSRQKTWFGEKVCSPGDLDRDGTPDLLVGPGDDGMWMNLCWAFSGRSGGALFALSADHIHDVSAAGDVDGDGIGDVILVSDANQHTEPENTGRVQVASGATGSFLFVEGEDGIADQRWTRFVSVAIGAGDLDGDGVPELLVGAPKGMGRDGHKARQYVELLSGGSAAVLFHWVLPTDGDDFGAALCALGDVDGDGLCELVVGAPKHGREGHDPKTAPGAIWIYSGKSGEVLRELHGTQPGERLGTALAGAGDLDGDGIPDLLAGCPRSGKEDRGVVKVFSGADGALLYSLRGERAWGMLGYALCSLEDLDGDGVRDIAVGEPGDPQRGNLPPGRVRLFSGRDGSPLTVLNDHADPEDAIPGHFGQALAAPGDVDGDGTPDLLVGAPWHTVARDRGSAWVISGDWLRGRFRER